jgi:AraC-like DNA-binding protein
MPDKNICKFIPIRNNSSDLITINFVYETSYFANDFLILHTYSINIAIKGEGVLHTKLGSFELKKGDLFLTYADQPFYIENKNNFEYIYITFIGIRANALMERLKIDFRNPVISDNEELIDIWQNALSISNEKNIDLISEGMLLYTLSYICNTYEDKEKKRIDEIDIILKVKKYLDDNFCNPDINLKNVSALFSYNDKYISEKFKKTIKLSFNQYLQKLRIDYSIYLMSIGIKNVNEIAKSCGYNDPFYYSKVFKKHMGVSPKQYLKQIC